MNFPIDYQDKLLCGDCLEIMKDMPDACLDLIITSPPFNLAVNKTFGKHITQNWNAKWNNSKLQLEGYDSHDDYMPEPQYIAWQKQILAECFRLIKPTGAIFYNQKWRVKKGVFQMRHEIVEGLPVRQIIIWAKAGGINFNEGYFLPTYEPIYLIAKPDFKLPPKINSLGDVWSLTQERKSWHPAAFPVELAIRCASATKGDMIMDPFMGSGTTAVAAKQLGKHYIGIDKSVAYCQKAEERLVQIVSEPIS